MRLFEEHIEVQPNPDNSSGWIYSLQCVSEYNRQVDRMKPLLSICVGCNAKPGLVKLCEVPNREDKEIGYTGKTDFRMTIDTYFATLYGKYEHNRDDS